METTNNLKFRLYCNCVLIREDEDGDTLCQVARALIEKGVLRNAGLSVSRIDEEALLDAWVDNNGVTHWR